MIRIDESWESIACRIGIKPWRQGRGECPFCQSRTGFSCHKERGFHCFACGIHGDKITLIQKFRNCDFKDALRFFSLEPGKPQPPDPECVRRRKLREGLRRWSSSLGRQLRYEHYVRERVIALAKDRLGSDADNSSAWDWLAWAYKGQDVIAWRLDRLDGGEADQAQAYREWRKYA